MLIKVCILGKCVKKENGRIVNYYKKSRLTFIVIEFLFFVMSTGGMIFLSFIVLTRYFV